MKRRTFCRSLLASGIAASLPAGRAFATAYRDMAESVADIEAVRLDGSLTTIEAADIQAFREGFSGDLLLPGNARYDAARRVSNGMIDRHPAMIARCANSSDVAAAVGRAPEDATAFAHCKSEHAVHVVGGWPDPADNETRIAAIRDYWSAIEPVSKGYYSNLNEEGRQPRVSGNFGGNLARLEAAKKRYDPANLFRLNSNIRPGS